MYHYQQLLLFTSMLSVCYESHSVPNFDQFVIMQCLNCTVTKYVIYTTGY